jgi:tRNA(Ile)-lysidine synthase
MTLPWRGLSSQNELHERVSAQIAPLLLANSSILIGLSGGVDSVVLLHLLKEISERFSWRLSALHVHHGISRNADEWARFCADLCARHHIPLHIEHVDIAPLRAHGIEAAARKLRHAAFARQSCDFVALAHHADDQVETLLLQLLRGAGVRGASGMPLISRRTGSPDLMRPLLHCTREEILAYATANQLQWIEDESNSDECYPRNYLRHRVLPLLGERFPAYRATLTRSARLFAEASGLLDVLAQQDAAQSIEGGALAVSALQALSQPRARNLLRFFLHRAGAPMPHEVQLTDMLRQLCGAREDAAVAIAYGNWQIRRYRGRAYLLPAPAGFDRSLVLPWQGETHLDWPAMRTRLSFHRVNGAGVSLAGLQRAPVTLRLRQGGETLRPHPDASARTLKNLLQERHIPPWQRDRLPLLYCGDELVCMPGVAIAAEYQAAGQEPGIQITDESKPA